MRSRMELLFFSGESSGEDERKCIAQVEKTAGSGGDPLFF